MARNFNLTANLNVAGPFGVDKVIGTLRSKLKSFTVDVGIKLDNKALTQLDQLNVKLAQVKSSVQSASTASKTLQSSLASSNRSLKGATQRVQSFNKAQTQMAKSAARTAPQIKQVTDRVEAFGRASGKSFRRFLGFSVSQGLILGFAGAVKSATLNAIEFERELVKVAQVTGRSIGSLSLLNREISRLSIEFGASSTELLDVARILAQTGLTATETRRALEGLAKSTLAPTFSDITQTVEGVIASFSQFGLKARDTEAILGSINAVAGKFAVESEDIISAIRRAGGVFAAASGDIEKPLESLQQFIAVFTAVRSTTRESAETIATGLRTIFARIQRPRTIALLEDLGAKLRDAKGQFIGIFPALDELNRILSELPTTDPRFAQIVEEVGGVRQLSKLIPLITQAEKRQKAYNAAKAGASSLDQDVEKALETLSVQLEQTQQRFFALIREMTNTESFKQMIKLFLGFADAAIDLAGALKPILPILAGLGAAKIIPKAIPFGVGFGKGIFGSGKDSSDPTVGAINANVGALNANTAALKQVVQANLGSATKGVVARSGISPTTQTVGGRSVPRSVASRVNPQRRQDFAQSFNAEFTRVWKVYIQSLRTGVSEQEAYSNAVKSGTAIQKQAQQSLTRFTSQLGRSAIDNKTRQAVRQAQAKGGGRDPAQIIASERAAIAAKNNAELKKFNIGLRTSGFSFRAAKIGTEVYGKALRGGAPAVEAAAAGMREAGRAASEAGARLKRFSRSTSLLAKSTNKLVGLINNVGLSFGLLLPILGSFISTQFKGPTGQVIGSGVAGGGSGAFLGSIITNSLLPSSAIAGPVGIIGGALIGATTSIIKTLKDIERKSTETALKLASDKFGAAVSSGKPLGPSIERLTTALEQSVRVRLKDENNFGIAGVFAKFAPETLTKSQYDKLSKQSLNNEIRANRDAFGEQAKFITDSIKAGLVEGKSREQILNELGGRRVAGKNLVLGTSGLLPDDEDGIASIIDAALRLAFREGELDANLQNKLKNVSASVDLFTVKLSLLESAFQNVTKNLEDTSTRIANVGSLSIAPSQQQRLGDNLSVELDDVFKAATDTVLKATGSERLVKTLEDIRLLQAKGPEIISTAIIKSAIEDNKGGSPEAAIADIFQKIPALKNLSKPIQQQFEAKILKLFQNRKTGGPNALRGLVDNPKDFFDLGPLSEAAKKVANQIIDTFNDFAKRMGEAGNKLAQSLIKVGEAQDRTLLKRQGLDKQFDDIFGFQRGVGAAKFDVNEIIQSQLKRGGVRIGAGANEIADEIKKVRDLRETFRDDSTAEATKQTAELIKKEDALIKALNTAANDTRVLAAIQKEVALVQKRREAGRGFARQLAGAALDPRQALDLVNQVAGAAAIVGGNVQNVQQLNAGNQFLDQFKNLLNPEQRQKIEELQFNRLLQVLQQQGAPKELITFLKATQGKDEEEKLQDEFRKAQKKQLDASIALEKVQTENVKKIGELIDLLDQKMITSLNTLRAVIDKRIPEPNEAGNAGGGQLAASATLLNRAAQRLENIAIPERIDITTAPITVNVNINGGEVLANIEKPVTNLVIKEVQKAIDKRVNPITGETLA